MSGARKPSGHRGREAAVEEPLHAAARCGDLSNVQAICASNPLFLNSRDRLSRTPLHLAAWSGHANVVRYLCKNNADVGAAAMDDMGAVHFASLKGHLEVVRVLLSAGVSVKATNRKGFTPLHYAAQGSHLDLAKYLVKKGASPSAKTKAGRTPRDLAESDEVRSFLKECEKEQADTSSNPIKPSNSQHCNLIGEQSNLDNERRNGKDLEADDRRSDVDEMSGTAPKKPRVALNHLLAENDEEEIQ